MLTVLNTSLGRKGTEIPQWIKSKLWFLKYFRIRTGGNQEIRAVWPQTAEVTPSLSLLPLCFTFPHGIQEIFSLSVVPGCYHSNTICLNCERGFNLLLAPTTAVKIVALSYSPWYIDIKHVSIFISRGVAFFKWKNSKQVHTWCLRLKANSSTCFTCLNYCCLCLKVNIWINLEV